MSSQYLAVLFRQTQKSGHLLGEEVSRTRWVKVDHASIQQGHGNGVVVVCDYACQNDRCPCDAGQRVMHSAALAGRLYNTMTGSCLATLTGHTGEISKVAFNPQVSCAA